VTVRVAIFKATLGTFTDVIRIQDFCLSLNSVFVLDCELSSVLHGSHELVHLNENQFPPVEVPVTLGAIYDSNPIPHKYLVDYRSGCISLRADEFLKCVLKVAESAA
jgi:hypothetical protein